MEQKTKRLYYLTLGWTFFTLGFVGAFMPVLPTTPFMILALGCFSKGSETLHNWLYNHPKFGPSLQDWEQYRMIPVKAKITAVTMMAISASWMIIFLDIDPVSFFGTTVDIKNIVLICALGLMAFGAIYVLTKPSRPEDPKPEPVEKEYSMNDQEDTPKKSTIPPEVP